MYSDVGYKISEAKVDISFLRSKVGTSHKQLYRVCVFILAYV